ncbi:MAG TPA: hypothetical protein ENN72_01640 [Firmicutes bacterium]|nr:hypothetical protein [Bacillota bacterium]
MFNTMKRPYKTRSAGNTIRKIKNILARIDLKPEITFTTNPLPGIHSCRVELNDEKGKFGTNGKGRTKEFSIASGYAEFMERIQNGFMGNFSRVMTNKVKDQTGCCYYPDEKYMTKSDFMALPDKIKNDLISHKGENRDKFIELYFKRLKENGYPGLLSIPFFDTLNNQLIDLPLNMLILAIGSNGMAAGNSEAEAIFQGLAEIMERWAAAEIYYGELTPPTVPDEYLKNFKREYKIINSIQQSGQYRVVIKDFSANLGLPSIGVMIIDDKEKKYKLNVGSDTSFQVALSRCLTEIYQGIRDDEFFRKRLLDIPAERKDYFIKKDTSSQMDCVINFSEFVKDGSGVYPKSLFEEKESYAFDPATYTPAESYEKEVERVIQKIHKLGHNVYIRNVSYLDFPTYLIYIPEISVKGRKSPRSTLPTKVFHIIELDKVLDPIFDMNKCSREELIQIAEKLEHFSPNRLLSELLNIEFKYSSYWKRLNLSFFLTQLWYKLGFDDKAYDNFCKFLDLRKDEKEPYYDGIKKYFELKIEKVSDKDIPDQLMKAGFEKELVGKVCEDMNDRENIFRYTKFPACPDCQNCELSDACLTRSRYDSTVRLMEAFKDNTIDQLELQWTGVKN